MVVLLYIGMDEVLQHHSHTFEKCDLNFQFQCELCRMVAMGLYLKYVTHYEKKGQLMEKHILQDCRKCLLPHANWLFALLWLTTTNPSKRVQA